MEETSMTTEPELPKVDIAQSAQERHEILEELERMAPDADAGPPPKRRDELTPDEQFAALQAQALGSGALGTDPYGR